MKKVFCLNGSPRRKGNTSHLTEAFFSGFSSDKTVVESHYVQDLNILPCKGCLRCNILKKCTIIQDDWPEISRKILESDILVIASPVYFHHLPAPIKMILDRFRSFVHVRITTSGLTYTPHQRWKKEIVLLLTMGSPDPLEAAPVNDLFEYMARILGSENRLHQVLATRLAVAGQISMSIPELEKLYRKLDLPPDLASKDHEKNQQILHQCHELARYLQETE